ncbi:MAG: matrixin family metalloprotease [Crocinitomicaceae bacterium]
MKKLLILVILLFIFSCQNQLLKKAPEDVVVAIQPYGKIPPEIMDTVINTLYDMYGFKIVVYPPKKLPKSAFINIKSPRYRADSILDMQERWKPDSIDYLMGLSQFDISMTDRDENGNIKKPVSKYKDWGVFGLGSCPGPTCVVSIFRLRKRQNYIDRLKKIVVHELGHNLGLPHCEDGPTCVMRDANENIKNIDKEKLELCSSCKKKLYGK